jgi:hypothetical protein
LDRFDQSQLSSPYDHAIHDIHDGIDNPPGDIGANGRKQKVTNTGSAFGKRARQSKGN